MPESARTCWKVPDGYSSANSTKYSAPLFSIFYAKQTHPDIHRIFVVSPPGSPLSPLQTPENLETANHLSPRRTCGNRVPTDVNVDDLFLMPSLSEHDPPEKRRSTNIGDLKTRTRTLGPPRVNDPTESDPRWLILWSVESESKF